MSFESLILQVKKITKRNNNLYYLNFGDNKKLFFYSLNKNWYEREKKAAGKFIIVTNTCEKAKDVMKTYKELSSVESNFNCTKKSILLLAITGCLTYLPKYFAISLG